VAGAMVFGKWDTGHGFSVIGNVSSCCSFLFRSPYPALIAFVEVKEKIGDGTLYCGKKMNTASVNRMHRVSIYDCIDD